MKYKVNFEVMEWQEGAVKRFFGKELYHNNCGGIKLVKVLPNSIYPLHHHSDKTEFVYVLKGNPIFKIDDNDFCSKENEFYIFPINKKHAIENNSDYECVLLVGALKENFN